MFYVYNYDIITAWRSSCKMTDDWCMMCQHVGANVSLSGTSKHYTDRSDRLHNQLGDNRALLNIVQVFVGLNDDACCYI